MKSLISHIFLILNPSICLQWNILISLWIVNIIIIIIIVIITLYFR